MWNLPSFKVATPGATECGIFLGSFEAYVGVKKKSIAAFSFMWKQGEMTVEPEVMAFWVQSRERKVL